LRDSIDPIEVLRIGIVIRVEGLGFRVEGLGFRVEGLGFKESC